MTEKRGAGLQFGVFDHIELWNPERLKDHFSESDKNFEDRAKIFFANKKKE